MKNNGFKFFLAAIIVLILFSVISSLFNTKKAETVKNSANTTVETSVISEYLEQFSGGYMVQIAGQKQGNDTEMFVLHSTGRADWKWIEVVNGKANILSEKSGSWSATSSTITIKIKGKSGAIEERYILTNGKFTSGSRTLLKTK